MLALVLLLTAYTYNFHDWLNLPAMDRVVSLTTDNFDVFAGVPRGVYQINLSDRTLVRTITRSDGIRGQVLAVAHDPQSNWLWILTTENLLTINTFSNFSFSYDLPADGINSLGITRDYILLASGNRYWQVEKLTGRIEPTEPGNRDITWHGERDHSSVTDYPFLVPYLAYDRELQPHAMTAVLPIGRKLCVGAEGYGLLLYSLASKQPLAHWQFGPAGNEVRRIFKFSDGLWFVGDQQLARYTPERDTWSYFATPFNAYFSDPGLLLRGKVLDLNWKEEILTAVGDTHNLWLGTTTGIYTYHSKTNILTRQLKVNGFINDILIAPDSVFMATDNGLVSYDLRKGGWTLFADTLRQMHFGVFGIGATGLRRYYAVYGGFEYQDTLGDWQLLIPPGLELSSHPYAATAYGDKLFAGTDRGLIVYDEKLGNWQTLTTESGLLSDRVKSLYADSTHLWVGTDAGVSRFNYRILFP